MGNIVVRLSSLTLKNIKNVKNGIIIMPLANERKFECSRAEILGIYGQNGSGKTAIVDALYFLQDIITGEELDQRIIDYIDTDSTNAEINAEFKIFGDNVLYEVGYHIIFSKIDDGVIIEREYLNCAINKDGNRTNNNGIILKFTILFKENFSTIFSKNVRAITLFCYFSCNNKIHFYIFIFPN